MAKKKIVSLESITNATWAELNVALKTIESEEDCMKLLEAEKAGKRRAQNLLRIYGRYSTLRGRRERNELFQ